MCSFFFFFFLPSILASKICKPDLSSRHITEAEFTAMNGKDWHHNAANAWWPGSRSKGWNEQVLHCVILLIPILKKGGLYFESMDMFTQKKKRESHTSLGLGIGKTESHPKRWGIVGNCKITTDCLPTLPASDPRKNEIIEVATGVSPSGRSRMSIAEVAVAVRASGIRVATVSL